MILHLKRFDLDFQTFETIKLNNRMAFPLRINMFEYTKEGIE
jgi:ubiquitin carboxyl-terminal hydrolase 9/24